ncbi:MAG: alpha/beta hydrolase [Solirubrobacterales bacterium]|nr:alpha/beta hydrolase [Solirubrobacterales bacterium]
MQELTSRTLAWRESGRWVPITGHDIFIHERPGPSGSPPLLFLHGYPSSSYDWRHATDRLAEHRLIMFDFLGFGLSDKPPDQLYSLLTQADIVEAIMAHFGAERVTLIAHDMGGSVATELLARDLEGRLPFELVSVLLFNASLVLERASLLVGQKLLRSRLGPVAARLTSEFTFRRQFGAVFSANHPLSDQEAADQWSLLTYHNGQRLLDRLIFYLHERVTYAARWKGALSDWPGRLELAWARLDPICTEAVLRAVLELRPGVSVTRLPDLGHYPQLEDPTASIEVIERLASEAQPGRLPG